MKKIVSNAGYFLKETFITVRMSLTSSILSLVSIGLIFFILAMVLSGWRICAEVVDSIKDQAEISVYYDGGMSRDDALKLVGDIKKVAGVKDSRLIDEKEAYSQMEKILGKESAILNVFDENPFTAYIEVNIDLTSIDQVLDGLKNIQGIDYVRDNRDVLDRLAGITRLFMFIGYLVLLAAGITTLVIISHIIRLAIQDNKEQINTLRLLGAPGAFIGFPFLLQGLLLSLGGGILASVLAGVTLNQVYAKITGPLPFIPLPSGYSVIYGTVMMILVAGVVLGIAGSLLGLLRKRV